MIFEFTHREEATEKEWEMREVMRERETKREKHIRIISASAPCV